MKTRELIRQLQEADPSGGLDCCIETTTDIYFVERLPAYYDGTQEILVRDPNKENYNIVGGIFTGEGVKVCIRSYSIEDALWDYDGKFPIEYIKCSRPQEKVKKIKDEIKKFLTKHKEWRERARMWEE